jgi:hypothetical protein
VLVACRAQSLADDEPVHGEEDESSQSQSEADAQPNTSHCRRVRGKKRCELASHFLEIVRPMAAFLPRVV